MSGEERTLFCLRCKPFAASYKRDVVRVVDFLFALPYLRRQVVVAAVVWQEPASLASADEASAVHREMADGGGRPHVVHGPYYWFAAVEYLSY